jgi:hypothetical protein
MSLICVSKEWHELTIQELYRIIQLRIEGFIVKNKTCYQDLEAHYDQNGWYTMYYDTTLGMNPQSMVGQTQFCTNKTFYGSDGTVYNYPAWRRQAWVPGYRDVKVEQPQTVAACMKYTGKPYMMCEVMEWYYVEHVISPEGGGYRCVTDEPYYDDAGRPNWVCVNDNIDFKERYGITIK